MDSLNETVLPDLNSFFLICHCTKYLQLEIKLVQFLWGYESSIPLKGAVKIQQQCIMRAHDIVMSSGQQFVKKIFVWMSSEWCIVNKVSLKNKEKKTDNEEALA